MAFGIIQVSPVDELFHKFDGGIVLAAVLLFLGADIDIFEDIVRRPQSDVYHMRSTGFDGDSFLAVTQRGGSHLGKIGARGAYRVAAVFVGHHTRSRTSQKYRYIRKRGLGNRVGDDTRDGCRLRVGPINRE